MLTTAFWVWLATVTIDTFGQLAFKQAARQPEANLDALGYWRALLAQKWLWLGVATYLIEFLVWLAFLSLVPLSQGVLLGSFNMVVIMLAGRWLYREALTPLRVGGILLITAGVALVGAGG